MTKILTMSPTQEVRRMAREAIALQNGSNSGGITRTLEEVTNKLHNSPDYSGTEWIHTNPIRVAILDKLCDLAGIQVPHSLPERVAIDNAHRACQELVDGKTVTWGI